MGGQERCEEAGGLGAQRYGLGVRKFSFLRPDGSLSTAVFGHGGLGGSLALADPERGITVAVTVNKLTLDAAATTQVLHLLGHELGLGTLVGAF